MTTVTPKEQGFYMPPEWHPHQACWMAWPCHTQTWENIGFKRAYQAYALVAEAIAQYDPIVMLVRQEDMTVAKQYLGSAYDLIAMP